MKKLVVGILFLGFIGTVLGYLLLKGYVRFNYPDKKEFPILGIDISHHQGTISWEELKKENISFVIIKATEGGDYKDPMFQENWKNSKEQGYRTGAYHFYRLCKNGKEQALNFMESVPHESNNLPPTIDLEFGGNCATDKSRVQVMEEVAEFLNLLEEHYGERPIIYATHDFYETYLTDHFLDYPLWIRDIFWKPSLDERTWAIWQFANRAHLKGIDGYVDLNVLHGDQFEF